MAVFFIGWEATEKMERSAHRYKKLGASFLVCGLLLGETGRSGAEETARHYGEAEVDAEKARSSLGSVVAFDLPNGLPVYVISGGPAGEAEIRLSVGCGSSSDPEGLSGLANLLTKLLARRAAQAGPEGQRLDVDAQCDRWQMRFRLKGPARELSFLVGELARAVFLLDLVPDSLEEVRLEAWREAERAEKDFRNAAESSLFRLLSDPSSTWYPPAGNFHGLLAIEPAHLADLHGRFVNPVHARLSLVAPEVRDAVEAVSRSRIGEIPGGTAMPPPSASWRTPGPAPREILVGSLPADAGAPHVWLAHRGLGSTHDEDAAAVLLNEIFAITQNAAWPLPSSPFDEAVESGTPLPGFQWQTPGKLFRVEWQLPTDQLQTALESLLREMRRLRSEPVSKDALEQARERAFRWLSRSLQSPQGKAVLLDSFSHASDPLGHLTALLGKLKTLDAEDLASAARRALSPNAFVLVVASADGKNPVDLSFLGEKYSGVASAGYGSSPDDPEARRLLEESWKNSGGPEGISDLSARGTFYFPAIGASSPIPGRIRWIEPDKIRFDLKLGEARLLQGSDGRSHWIRLGPFVRETARPPGEEIGLMAQALFPLGNLRDHFPAFRLVGRRQLEHRTVVVLEGHPSREERVRVSLNSRSLLVYRIDRTRMTPTGLSREIAFTGSYRGAGRGRVPTHWKSFRNGQKLYEIRLENVKFNAGLEPGLFQKPE